jgi:hypothetical protein
MPSECHTSSERPATLEEETKTAIEEARMVLPGIQALFGFQLVAVHNNRFHDLTGMEQILHLFALILVALAAGLSVDYERFSSQKAKCRFQTVNRRKTAAALLPDYENRKHPQRERLV